MVTIRFQEKILRKDLLQLPATLRTFLAVASAKQWELHQMDVLFIMPFFYMAILTKKCTCLYHRCSLSSKQGLSVEKITLWSQTPPNWFAKLASALRSYGFIQMLILNSLYYINYGGHSLFSVSSSMWMICL